MCLITPDNVNNGNDQNVQLTQRTDTIVATLPVSAMLGLSPINSIFYDDP